MMKYIYLIITILLLSACSSMPYAVTYSDESIKADGKIYPLYVVNHGWHTGLVIPAQEILSRIPLLRDRFGDTPYIEFGWGDSDFYQATEITTGLTLKAILWPTKSIMHAVSIPVSVDEYFQAGQIKKLCLSNIDYFSLVKFIENSFYKTEKGEVVSLKKGIYGNSQFYQGQGDYYLMNTCNKWTAKGLKSAGMDITPSFYFTAGGIMDFLAEHNKGLTRCES